MRRIHLAISLACMLGGWPNVVCGIDARIARGRVDAAQENAEVSILKAAVAAARKAEPDWKFEGTMINAPGKLIDEELGVSGGGWYRADTGLDQGVHVMVYRIATEKAAAQFILGQARGAVAPGWTVTPYDLGDAGNIASYRDNYRNVVQYNLSFRKGRFLAILTGRSSPDVERFARLVLAAMSGEQEPLQLVTLHEQSRSDRPRPRVGPDCPLSAALLRLQSGSVNRQAICDADLSVQQ